MAASQEQKVDFLLKKIGYTASKTGIAEDETGISGTKKAPFAEPIPSPLTLPGANIWSQSNQIPATPPGATTSIVRVYKTGTAQQLTFDSTVADNRSFVSRETPGEVTSTVVGDWVDTQFGSDYIVKVYKGDPNSGGVQLSAAGSGSNDTWFFDYSAGVLNFNGTNVPSGITTTNIYIEGYRYTGIKGITGVAQTFTDLEVSGIATFNGPVDMNSTLDVDGHTNLDNVSIAGVTTFADGVAAKFGTDGDLEIFHNNAHAVISNTTGNLHIKDSSIKLQGADSTPMVVATQGSSVELYHANRLALQTQSGGVGIVGILTAKGVNAVGVVTATTFSGSGASLTGIANANISASAAIAGSKINPNFVAQNIFTTGTVTSGDINISDATPTLTFTDTDDNPDFKIAVGSNAFNFTDVTNDVVRLKIASDGKVSVTDDFDVDGHTNLDNVSVAGVSTFTGNATFSGNVSIAGTLTYEDVSNIDSVGIITARKGVRITGGGLTVVGVSTFNDDIVGDTATNISGINTVAANFYYGCGGAGSRLFQNDSQGNLIAGSNAGLAITIGNNNW